MFQRQNKLERLYLAIYSVLSLFAGNPRSLALQQDTIKFLQFGGLLKKILAQTL